MKCIIKFRPSIHSNDGTTLYTQDMIIEVSVPRDTSTGNFPLILNIEEVKLVSTLILICGVPKTKLKNGRQTWLFKHSGTEILYRPSRNGCEPLLFIRGREYKINSKLRVLHCTETAKDIKGRVEDTNILTL